MATINGTSSNDTLNGTSGDDTLSGLGGNDELVGSGGNDFYDGGSGSNDTLELKFTATPTVVDFGAGTISGGFTGTFVNMERVVSGDGNDSLIGAAGAQNLSARAGNDTLAGGAGNDWLWGGGGNDTFIFRETGSANADRMGDFTSGSDKIVLDATAIAALGAEGNFSAGDARFTANSSGTAQDASDRIIYETDTRQLWYDPDGTGAAGRQLIATLENTGSIAATDIVVQGGGTSSNVINGTSGNDTLTGTAGDDSINGLDGNDSIVGGAGFDTLQGDAGNDTLSGGAGVDSVFGGAGADQFILDQLGTVDADGINDFATGVDKLVLDGSLMTAIGPSGPFATGDERFYAAAGATSGHDSTDRIIFDSAGLHLWYDPDGSGPAASQYIGGFSPTSLAATDFVVINGTMPAGAINGTAGNDTLTGTPGDDTINGLGGNDSISGLAGNDSISGGDGNDTMDGGPGADTLDGGAGNDTYVFNASEASGDLISDASGVDTVVVTSANAVLIWHLQPGIENLTLRGSSFFVVGEGNSLDNVLRNEGTAATEGYLDGGDGNDTLIGGPYFLFQVGSGDYGHDFVDGAGDNGTLILGDDSAVTVDFRSGTAVGGGSGGTGTVDFIDVSSAGGGRFDDTFIADDGGVFARGNAGNDTFVGGAGNDTFSDDTQVIYDGADVGGVDSGDDSLSGGDGADQLIVNRGNDTVQGGAGNDSIFIQVGGWSDSTGYTFNDALDGGAGVDALSIIQLSAVDVNLGTGAMSGGGDANTGSATLAGIENFSASRFAGFANRIVGSAASNALAGSAGADTLNGAGGIDTLTGYDGADQFLFDQIGAANADHVTDFAGGIDDIDLDANAMAALGASGNFTAGDARFYAAAGASGGHDADDRVVYNTTTGQLFYDADGNGASGAQLIATLDGAPTLAAADILVFNGSSGGGSGTPGDVINGTSANDTLTGTAGDDTLNGLGGNDELLGSGGNDFFDGGSGNSDTLNLRETSTPTTVNFAAGTISGGFTGTFVNMERVLSGLGNDSLIGTAGAQNLSARAGNDTLEGGTGNDWLWGGGGDDTFIFREAGSANADNMGDFSSGLDTLAFDNATLAALGADGDFASGDGRFFAGAGANGGHDANDRLIYNTSTGQLYYDDDGSGAHAAQLVATLQGAPTLAASDITVI